MLTRFKKLTLSLLILSVSGSIFAQPVLVKSKQQIEEYKLDNGLRIILAENNKENKVFMNTVYFTGSLNDPKGKGGLAHLLEHLAFKGTQNVKGEEFQRRLDQYTLMNNASTDYYSTRYINLIRPEKTAINEMIYLEAERMDKLVLEEKFVPSEISIVEREREIRLDQPVSVLLDQIFKSAYGNENLGRLPIGDLKELQSIKMNELNTFYRNWYAPNNAVIVIAGKFDKAEVLKQIDKSFSPIPARAIPAQATVPKLDPTNFKNKNIVVEKGSDLFKLNIYLNGKDDDITTSLAITPVLYTMQPSGHLYKSMVETGLSTEVFTSTRLDQDLNMVVVGAVYSPTKDAKAVQNALNTGVEQAKAFDDKELNRAKNLVKNSQDSMFANAQSVGSMLSEYVVAREGDWTQYFKDQDQLQNMTVDQVNKNLKSFFTPQNRVVGDIKPTPEDQKKALEHKGEQAQLKSLDQTDKAEPLKDISTYQNEIKSLSEASKKSLASIESKIERGTLKNGAKYALYPVSTLDGKTYAEIDVDFGSTESLFNKGKVIDLAAYLMLRGSEKYSLQDIADKFIEVDGSASAYANGNGISINIVSKKENFEEFFKFVIELMKEPKFEQTQFDLIKAQSLAELDRPYTEPSIVAGLTLTRLVEVTKPGDIRYHFEPELDKKQLEALTNEQVKQLHKQFFAMDHAKIAITGEYDAKKMKKLLKSEFSKWNGTEKYEEMKSPYVEYKAQNHHVLAEQREFGNYVSVVAFPVGSFHLDTAALVVLGNILGESQLSSRLAQELREKNGLVYGFGSSLNFSDSEESGAFGINANYTTGKAAQVSQAVHKVFKDLMEKGVTEQEVAAAKADIFKKRVTALEDERRVHNWLTGQLDKNKDMLAREQRDQEFLKVTKADVDAVIKKYLKLENLVEVMADQYGKPMK